MSMIAAFMVPHPPMIIPQIGRGSEEQIRDTIEAYEQVAAEICQLDPQTIIIISPHSIMYSDYIHISPGAGAAGSFSDFGAGKVRFQVDYDRQMVDEICRLAEEEGIEAGTLGERNSKLDHGTMVPLWFIDKACHKSHHSLVRIGISGLPMSDHYRMGMIIGQAANNLGRSTVIVASGDLSHKLKDHGPYGYVKEGPQYDERIMDVCARGAFGELLEFDEGFCEKAAECGHRAFVMMAGAFDGREVETRVLSYQDVTGVGYGICTFHPGKADGSRHFLADYMKLKEAEAAGRPREEDPYVRLARSSMENYILRREHMEIPKDLPEEMTERRAGVFVSIHKNEALRGCIGTIGPVTDSIAREVIENAISAATKDPRFPPIGPDELDDLRINVDVLGEPEEISSQAELDVHRYGVIVSSGSRRGLLLPDLEGVDTVAKQVGIARQKAGIAPHKKVRLQRFEVIRHR